MRPHFLATCLMATALSGGAALAQANNTRPQAAEHQSESTQDFVNKAAIGGMFEIQSSQLALKKSQDHDIQQFAQRMINDHTRAEDQLKSLAKGMTVPSNLDDEHKRMLDQLQQANGSDFVSQYKDAQIKAHQEAVSLFQSYARNGSDAQIKQFAQQTLPTLQEHLQMAQRIDVAANNGGNQQQQTAAAGNTSYITHEDQDSWRASKVVGLGVYNEQGDKIGTINEVLFRKDGQVDAVVIGVGGFLGIGERYVAVPYKTVQWSMTPPGRNQANNDNGRRQPNSDNGRNQAAADNGRNQATADNGPAGAAPTAGAGLATTPTPSTQDQAPRTSPLGTQTADNGNNNPNPAYPDHAVLPNASKDQLQQAPQFQWGSSPR